MELTTKIISWVIFVLPIIIFIYMIYYNLMSLRGYFCKPDKVPFANPKARFLIIVPAFMEENVIDIPIKCLTRQHYPSQLYDTYVGADGSTDNTAKIARECGAHVITAAMNENYKRVGIGKSANIDYTLNQIPDWDKKYDYLMIVDSDNEISQNFLMHMNDYIQYYNYPEVLQSRLDSKNGTGSITNTGLNSSFLRSTWFQQIPEGRYGACSVLGTGFCVKTDQLHGHFAYKTLVEDESMELTTILNDGRVMCVPEAYVINENYASMKAGGSIGILRWSRGSYECFLRYAIPSIIRIVKHPFQVRSWHVFARINSLSKAQSLILLWIAWIIVFLNNTTFNENVLTYNSIIIIIVFVLNLIMSINMVLIENLYVMRKAGYSYKKIVMTIVKTYLFQLCYLCITSGQSLPGLKSNGSFQNMEK